MNRMDEITKLKDELQYYQSKSSRLEQYYIDEMNHKGISVYLKNYEIDHIVALIESEKKYNWDELSDETHETIIDVLNKLKPLEGFDPEDFVKKIIER